VTFKPSLPIGLVAIGTAMLAASGVYWFGLRELRGGQFVVPLVAGDEDEHLASSLLAVARAAAAHGANRMAITLAHEAAQVCLARAPGALVAADWAELTAMWHDATGGALIDIDAPQRATELAARILAAPPKCPPSA